MGMKNRLSCVYDAFSCYRVSFSSIMSLTTMGLCPGPLVRLIFRFALEIILVVSVE